MICSANQWTGLCIIGTSVMKELMLYEIQKCILDPIKRLNDRAFFAKMVNF